MLSGVVVSPSWASAGVAPLFLYLYVEVVPGGAHAFALPLGFQGHHGNM